MDPSELFHDESIIYQSNNAIVTLTNKRLRYQDKSSSVIEVVSILLQNISAIEVQSRKYPILLVFAAIAALFGIFALSMDMYDSIEIGTSFFIGCGVLILMYMFIRRSFVSVHPHGGRKLEFTTSGMKHEKVMEFVNKVEKQITLSLERQAPAFSEKA